MARTSLAERMSRLEQQRARLAEQEAKIRADERKQRTRRLIEAGSLVERAGLLDLDDHALFGALLSLAGSVGDNAKVGDWTEAGKAAINRLRADSDMPREALIVTFEAPLPTAFSTRLRGAGLRWNKVLHHWEGVANFETIAALAAEQNGSVRRVQTEAQPDPGSDRGIGQSS
jgi:Conjugal transfer protein TraD